MCGAPLDTSIVALATAGKARANARPPEGDQMGKAKEHGFSQERLQRIDRFLQEKYVGPGRMPCAQFLLARDGEVVHQTVLGQQDPERGVKLAEDTVFRIYSMTKPIT